METVDPGLITDESTFTISRRVVSGEFQQLSLGETVKENITKIYGFLSYIFPEVELHIFWQS